MVACEVVVRGVVVLGRREGYLKVIITGWQGVGVKSPTACRTGPGSV